MVTSDGQLVAVYLKCLSLHCITCALQHKCKTLSLQTDMGPSLSCKLVAQEVANFELKLKQSAIYPASQLTGWVYWQRDPRGSPNCWTKVFAVLDSAFLRLFQREESAPRSLLLQVAVASVEEHDGRLLQVVDPAGEQLCISLYEDDTFELWESRLKEAADLTNAFFCTLEGSPALKTMESRWRTTTRTRSEQDGEMRT